VSGPDLHPEIAALAGLLGTWEGEGQGDYPTIEPFTYRERVTFGHVGKPFLAYGQRTWSSEDGAPLHAETGYLRMPRAGRVELVLAHPTGIVEVEEGAFDGSVVELSTSSVGLTATAKAVRSVRRRFVLADDELTYDLWMAYGEIPETHHLHATLHRSA
jgi:hypothetical protein